MSYDLEIMCKHAIDRSCEISTSTTLPPTNSSSTSPKGVDYGMLSLVISCTLLKGIKHQFTLCALIIRRTCRGLMH